MKHTTFASKTARHSQTGFQQNASAGQNAISITPPDYGIDYVDKQPAAIQAKLKIGAPNDKYEQEADRMAEQVMSTTVDSRQKAVGSNGNTIQTQEGKKLIQPKPFVSEITPLVQRQVEKAEEPTDELAEGEEEIEPVPTEDASEMEPIAPEEEPEKEDENTLLQAKQVRGAPPRVGPNLEVQIRSLRGGGRPLSHAERSFFEPRFGYDFSQVQIHADSKASETAESINAKAFTTGSDIVFAAAQYSPDASVGKHLLAHELVHVVQQGAAPRVSHIKASRKGEAPVRPPAGAYLTDGTDVVRMAPFDHWKLLMEIKGKADELKDVLNMHEEADDLLEELSNPKPTKAEKWVNMLIHRWSERTYYEIGRDFKYEGWEATATFIRLVKKKDVVGLIDASVEYSGYSRTCMKRSKRARKLKRKYRKAYNLLKYIAKRLQWLGIWKNDHKMVVMALRVGRLAGSYFVLCKVLSKRARLYARQGRYQKKIARLFDKASEKLDRELNGPMPESGPPPPAIVVYDVIKNLITFFRRGLGE